MRMDVDESRRNNESFRIDGLLGINSEVLADLGDSIFLYNDISKEPGVATSIYNLAILYVQVSRFVGQQHPGGKN